MSDLFESGHIVYWILALMCIELIVLFALRRAAVLSMTILEAAASLGAGAALLLALKGALRNDGWHVVALWLVAGLAAHSVDLTVRLRRDVRLTGGKNHAR